MTDIVEALHEVKKSWRTIAIVTLIFILIAMIFSTFFIKEEYEAKVKVFVGKQNFTNVAEEYNNEEVQLYQRLITTYSELLKSKKLINKSINESAVNKGKEDILTYNSVINNLTIKPVQDTQIIELKYNSYDGQESYDLIYSITENLIGYSKELYPTVNIKVLEQVNVDYINVLSKKVTIIFLGLFLGLFLSVGYRLMLVYMNNTFNKKESLEKEIGISVLGVIPHFEE